MANDYQRTKVAADRLADEAVRDGSPLIRVYPGVVYGPGSFTEGNLVGRLIADHLKHKLPGLVGPEQPLVVRLRRRRRGGTLRGARARRAGRALRCSAARTRRSAASSRSCSS